jgi:hypothetical protein
MADGTSGPDNFTVPTGSSNFNGFGGVDTLVFNFKLTEATFTWVGNQVVIVTANSHTVVTGFEIFQFTDGTVNNADGNSLVDDLFYNATYHDVWNLKLDAEVHYAQYGWHEKRDPSAFFDTSLYLDANPSVKASGLNPLTHYAQTGWKLYLDPAFTFDTALYLKANPDVAAAGINPLDHFLTYGAGEGRQPFAASPFVAVNGFDYAYYMANNPDVVAAGVDAFAHFQAYGWKEGRNPNDYFDTKGYLATYTDVAAAGVNPLDHYNTYGWKEGRIPSPSFDTNAYLAAYPDVAAANINPLKHFLVYGIQEGRQAFPSALFDKQVAADSVLEGAATGTQVGVTATWGGWISPTLVYSITNDTSGGAFTINPSTGVITVADGTLLDFETVTSHSVTVQAQAAGQTTTHTFVIAVADAAPVIPPGAAPIVSVNELAANGTTFGLAFQVSDPNGPAPVYSLSNDAGGRFTIDAATGEISVANGAAIDFETSTSPGGANTYQVTAVGTVGSSNASQTFTININDINEEPQGTDNTVTVLEDGEYTFTAADFGFSDPADSTAPDDFNGVFIDSPPVLGLLTKNGNPVGPGDFITAAEISGGDLKFTPAANGNGTAYASFTFRVQDDGGTANGGVDTDQTANTMTIDVTAVNDAPTATPQSTTLAIDEDAAATALFTTPPTVADVEGDALTATLTVSNTSAGVLAGGGFTPTGNPGEYAFSGSAAQLTAALAAVQFDSADDFSGSTDVTVAITDGASGPQGTNPSWMVAVTINAVNDAPTATPQSATLTIDEDSASIALFTTPPTVADVEGDALTATLTVVDVAAGVLIGGGFTPTGNPGEYAFSGTAAQLTAALADVEFDSADDFNGTTEVTVAITDGNSGPQGTNPSWTVAVTVNAVNDAPTASPQSTELAIDEDAAPTPLFTSPPTVADVDGDPLTATLTLANPAAGTLTGGGFAPTGNPGEYAFTGSPAQLTTALAAVAFDSALNFSGSTSVAVDITDGSNGPQGTNPSWTVDITVDEVNDEPTVTATANNPSYVPGADLFSSVTASTVEAGQFIDEIVLSVTNVTGADEFLTIDGVDVPLVDGTTVPTTTAGVTAAVTVAGTTATITILSATGLTGAEAGTLIDGLAYTKTTVGPGELPRTVTIVSLHDTGGTDNGGDDTGNPGLTSTVNFNIPPTIEVDATLNYTENQSAQVIDATITITDSDDADMEGAVVKITGNYAGAEDILDFNSALATGFGISGIVAGDTLTLTGTATKAEYELVLESVTYRNSSDNPSTAPRTVSFTINDGYVDSLADTATINVTAQNDAPFAILSGVTSTYTEDGSPVAVDAGLTVGDVDNTTLVSALIQFANGTGQTGDKLEFTPQFGIVDSDVLDNQLTLTGTATLAEWQTVLRSITFSTTNQDPTTSRDISIQVNDGTAGSTPVIKAVTVTPVNDEPTLTATANGGGTVTFTESGDLGGTNPVDLFSTPSASAIEAGQLLHNLVVTISNVTDATEFLIAGTGATAIDLVNGNVEVVSLAGGGTASATVGVDVSGLATITFNTAGGMTAAQVSALVDSFAYDNTDDTPTAGPAVHTVTITSLSDNGSNTAPNDNTAALNISVNIDVVATNDAPVAANVTFKATGGTFGDGTAAIGNTSFVLNDPTDGAPDPAGPQKIVTGDLLALASDVDSPHSALTIVPDTINDATFGTLIIQADGDFTYLPKAGFSGDAVFNYAVSDNDALNPQTGNGTITISVDAPKVWYVDFGADAGGDGTSDNPFNTLAPLNGAGGVGDVDGIGDIIFVYGNASHYTGGLTLENNQQLIGQSVGLTVNGTALETASGSNPFIDGGVVLAQNNTISGISFGDAAAALSGTNFGTLTISASSISTNGTALSLNTGTVAGTGFTSVTTTGGAGSGIVLNTMTGALTIGTVSINGVGNHGIDITNTNGSVTINGGNIGATNDPGGNALNVDNGTGAITIAASLTKTGGGGNVVDIDNHETGNISLTGNINSSGGGGGISVVNSNSGTIAFTGQTIGLNTGAGAGVSLANNTGGTINFGPAAGGNGLDITTTTGTGFSATGGGTVSVTGTGNTINSGNGTALNITNTTIGSSHVTFQSISSNGGTATGIILDNTGTSGGLHVTGNGTNVGASGGGVIANKTGADGSTTSGIGIYLNNTSDVQLNGMQLNDFQNFAIRGLSVNGFTLDHSNISGANGNNVGVDEGAVVFGVRNGTNGLTGTASIANTSISGGAEDNIGVYNTSGTLNLTVNNVASSGAGNDGMSIEQHTGGTINVDVRNSDFTNNIGDHFQSATNGAANINIKFGTNGANTLANNLPHNTAVGGSIAVGTGIAWSGSGSADISNNTITFAEDTPINLNIGGTGTFNAVINNNTIGTSGVANSGTYDNEDAIRVVANGDKSVDGTPDGGTLNVAVTNNTIQNVSGHGIFVIARDGGTAADPIRLNITIQGNLLRESVGSEANGIRLEAGASSTPTPDDVIIHANIGGAGALANTFVGDWGGAVFDEIRLRHQFSGTSEFILTGLGSNTSDGAIIAAYLAGRNNLGGGVASATTAGGGVYQTGGTPTLPVIPLLAADGGVTGISGVDGDFDLSASELAGIVQAAVVRWAAMGLSDAQLALLDGLHFDIADLGDAHLGITMSRAITIDQDAAGRGWFIDTSPFDDHEFGHAISATQLQADPLAAPAGHMDLLTVVMHEIGHALGFDHSHDPSGDLMSETLVVGERRLPVADEAHAILVGDGFDFSALEAAYAASPATAALFDLLDFSMADAAELMAHTQGGWVDVAQLLYGLHLGEAGHALLVRDGWQV